MTDEIDLREFVGGFVSEVDELVGIAHASLAVLERGGAGAAGPRAVRELFRALHTIKGLAGMIGVEPIVEIAHALETVVRNAERSGGKLAVPAIAGCLQGVDAIAERVRAVAEGRTPARPPQRLLDLIARVDTHLAPAAAADVPAEWTSRLSPNERAQLAAALEAGPVWTVTFLPSDDNVARGHTIGSVRGRLAGLGEIIKVLPRSAAGHTVAGIAFDVLIASAATRDELAEAGGTLPEHVVALATPPVASDEPEVIDEAERPAIGRSFVRVETSRLDALQEQLSLLIVSRFKIQRALATLAERGVDVRALRDVVEHQARLLRDLRRAILQARLVRASEVLEPLLLLVRSLARSSGKSVEIEIEGTAELDKAVADRLLPALIHLIRNAVDHAIESPDERAASDKPRIGQIRVTCRELAGSEIELVISDDGRGIDRAVVAAKSHRAVDDDAALLDVITRPGFSTRDLATRTSGRGLGMDIVRKVVVGELGGELSLTTAAGRGTTFVLRVPVTIAVLDVFTLECGGQAFVVPVTAVDEIFELDPADVIDGPATGGAAVRLIQRRGRAVPLLRLGAILALDDGARARKALLVRRDRAQLAFAVDRLIGRQEVVIRPIEDPLGRAHGIAGATDIGDGRPTLVLDLGELAVPQEAA